MKKISINLCFSVLLFSLPLQAQDNKSSASEASKELQTMVVIASKVARPLADVAGSVAVINATDIEENVVQSVDDMLRYQPGINVERAGTRFASEGINIRGIGGNRVAIEIDGVPVQSQFSLGSFSNTGRDTLEVDTIKRVEILSGPASTLYGSRAIGGVMAVSTWDPQDLIHSGTTGLRGSVGFNSVDNSWVVTGGAAWQEDNAGLLAFYTHRDGHQPENRAGKEFADDLQDWDSDSLLAKFVWDAPSGNRLRLSFNGFQQDADTDVRSIIGIGRFRSTSQLLGKDSNTSNSLSADYEFTTSWLDQGVARFYYQDSSIDQQSFEARPGARTPVKLERRFFFDQNIMGLELNGFEQIVTGNVVHKLGFGLEYQEDDIKEKRDAFSTNLNTGESTNIILGEAFPTRDFPISTTTEVGLFIHDEMQLGDSAWRLIPGIRYDRYKLDPRRDAIFDLNNAAVNINQVTDSGLSPKLGVLYHLDNDWSLFGQYARGFRAPPSQDVNRSLFLPLFNFRVLPNPDLRSETSDGFELGIRNSRVAGNFSASFFWTEYDDFIESAALLGFDPPSGELLFQSRNITNARIYGAEVHWQHPLEQFIEGLSFEGGAFWSRGENLDNNEALNTVSPPQLVAGLNWHSQDQRFRTAVITTFTAEQDRIDETAAARFATPSYGIIDLTAGWKISNSLQLEVGVFNLLDKKYWRWNDVSKFSPDDAIIEILSRPGRNFSANFKMLL